MFVDVKPFIERFLNKIESIQITQQEIRVYLFEQIVEDILLC